MDLGFLRVEFIFALIKSVADAVSKWFGWAETKEREKKDAVDKTTSGIGKGKPFIIIFLLLIVGCGYIYTVSTPMAFDAEDFQYLKGGQEFTIPNDGYYFSNEALEKYIRSKIAEYEVRKRGFYHKAEEN